MKGDAAQLVKNETDSALKYKDDGKSEGGDGAPESNNVVASNKSLIKIDATDPPSVGAPPSTELPPDGTQLNEQPHPDGMQSKIEQQQKKSRLADERKKARANRRKKLRQNVPQEQTTHKPESAQVPQTSQTKSFENEVAVPVVISTPLEDGSGATALPQKTKGQETAERRQRAKVMDERRKERKRLKRAQLQAHKQDLDQKR